MGRVASFRWDRQPSTFGDILQQRVSVMNQALEMLAMSHAARGESSMKANAGWNDRTAFARASLFGRADGLTIYLGTSNDEYGIFLELGTSKMSAFPTIGPQLRQTSAEYFADAVTLTGAILIGGGA